MGLAASQARFLGITLRKANLEFKSTELAQQKLQLTDQMSQISQDYSNAINATKLTWVNEDCEGNYGLTYSLLMMPSAANDYNPFMVTTKSGAVVLNAKYQAAAQAAGISMAGGIPSAEGYKKFVKEMNNQGLVTDTTKTLLLAQQWHSTAGLGAIPKDKRSMTQLTLSDLMTDDAIGGQYIDWLQVYREALGYEYDDKATDGNYNSAVAYYDSEIARFKRRYSNATDPALAAMVPQPSKINYGTQKVNEALNNAEKAVKMSSPVLITEPTPSGDIKYVQIQSGTDSGIMEKFVYLERLIAQETNGAKKAQYIRELENYKNGLDPSGNVIDGDDENLVKNPLFWSVYEKAKYMAANSAGTSDVLKWADNPNANASANSIGFNHIFYTGTENRISGQDTSNAVSDLTAGVSANGSDLFNNRFTQLNLYINDIMQRDAGKIKSLTLADILRGDVVLVTQVSNHNANGAKIDQSKDDTAIKSLQIAGTGVLDFVARLFGYGSIGTGLNIDASTDEALKSAYDMVVKKFLDSRGAVIYGTEADDSDPYSNSAYKNGINYNRIGSMYGDGETYAALDLSSMVSAFLTYYDNALRGADSEYVVGKGNDGGSDGGARTYFVTDDPNYVYITTVDNSYSNDEKINDFYSELYNSICEHGWRYDGNLDDYEYLESTIKDGRYSLMALNSDGYYYQSKYNDIEYIVEEEDRDAIARAEADFTRKKAEINNKEDIIDIKTKKLDAEIMELTTELNSVQNLISKSIEKTFAMFSN